MISIILPMFGMTIMVCCYLTYPDNERKCKNDPKKYKPWKVMHNFARMRAIALFWQEQTQIHLCAHGGRGRKEDCQEFSSFSEQL